MRRTMGLIAGAVMVLSSAAHSFLGWRQLEAALLANHAPADLVRGLAIGWHFSGGSMLVFGCIVLAAFARPGVREPRAMLPALLIALLYLVAGTWALVASDFNLFFLVFIVPGLLLAAAALPAQTSGRPAR